MLNRLLLLLGFLPLFFSLKAQDIKFSKISVDDGLSSNTINCVYQDFRGFLWVGTPDGLHRYDGYNFDIFRNSGDSVSLSDNSVWSLAETKDNVLWVGTANGLNKFDRRTKSFKHIHSQGANAVNHHQIMSLLVDKDGALWVGSLQGLTKMTFNAGKESTQNFKGSSYTVIENKPILSIAQDEEGNMWFAADSTGLYKMTKEGVFEQFNLPIAPTNKINSLAYDKFKKNLWVGTDNGLLRIDKEGKIKHFQSDEKKSNSLKENLIHKVFVDSHGKVWVGTATQGLCLFRANSETFSNYKRDINNPHSISDNNYFRAIYEDKTGILWFGTQEGGLNKYDVSKVKFTTISGTKYFNFTMNSGISVIHEDHNGHLWLGATDGGITRIAPTYTKTLTSKDGLMSNKITGIENDRYGSAWFSTKDRGVGKFAYTNGKMSVVAYQAKRGTEDGLPNNQIQKLFKDKEGEIWVCTADGSLCKFNRSKNDFEMVLEGVKNTKVPMPVFVNAQGLFWIGTPRGYYLFDPKTSTIVKDYRGKNAKAVSAVYALRQTSDTILWIGSIRGLSKFNLKKDSLYHYSSKQGLIGDVVFSILDDSLGNLWITTNKGLSKYNDKTKSFRNYDASNGLQSGEFLPNATLKNKAGKFYFGGASGYNTFFPSQITDNPIKPQIVFLDLEIFSKPLIINVPIVTDRTNRDVETSEIDEISLYYEDYNFDIRFAALHFADPKKNQYEYILEGYDTKWNKRDFTRRFISYNNLPYGDYVLRVRASNADGVWNDKGIALKIIVHPPFWEKWAFKIGLVIFILGSIYIFNAVRLRRIKRQNAKLELLVEERTEEIREKTTQILDSIRYAETIQAAILPTEDEFKRYLPNGFKIYLPRDIVSGDFYWLKKVKDKTYMAVVDCTGHGVPGAFMSMIGASLLNDIVNQGKNIQPDEILASLNEKIRIALRQEDERNTDGMDIAICMLEENSNILKFSGAKRTLYIVRHGEVIEVKGDRKSVGGRLKKDKTEKDFTTKTFELQTNDVVYLTTDGYVDQPNEEGNKFGTLKFFKEIQNIGQLKAQEQEKHLKNVLAIHSGKVKQRDDITILAFKV